MEHFGQWLGKQIALVPQTKAAFGRRAGIPTSTLMAWIGDPKPGIRADNVTRLANALNIPREEIERRLGLFGSAAA